jgi:hypothetical protein
VVAASASSGVAPFVDFSLQSTAQEAAK